MSLGALARVAAFSPFHFHRIFRAVTGETLFGFIQRVRLERSAGALLAVPDRSVLEVALDHGFSSSATFARAFKGHFGMSATEWRRDGAERWPERRRLNRKLGKQLASRATHGRFRRPILPLFGSHVLKTRSQAPWMSCAVPVNAETAKRPPGMSVTLTHRSG